MAQRRFGPVRGAGVSITELEGDKPIEPGALGWAAYGGILEKGNVGELIQCSSKSQFIKKCGSYIEDSLLPDACIDFFDEAAGRGGLFLVRVTDGEEVQAEKTLYCRKLVRTAMGKLKAKNGGRWGGKAQKLTDDVTGGGDITNTTIDTGKTMLVDEWKGGYVELAEVSNKQYPIISNDATGVVTVAADQTMKDDWTAGGGGDLRYYLVLENEGKQLSYEIRDGEEKPTEEFGLFIYVDDELVLQYPNLHTNPTHARYWVNKINNDGNNDEVEAEDLWVGAHAADVRPANYWGEISSVTETVLTAVIHEFIHSVGDADATVALGTTTDDMVAQVITIVMSDASAFNATSDVFGALGSGTEGAAFTPNNKWTPPFTITNGATVLEAGDTMVLTYKPFVADELIDGYLYPDKPNATREKYRITDNDHETITVAAGSDLTASGAPADEFMVVAPLDMAGGKDGNNVVDADYTQQVWDTSNSPFNRIFGKNMGLIKCATPGITSTAVQKAGAAYAEAKNHQYRYEVPSNKVTEQEVDEYINDTLGRNDFAVVSFPSYAYVADPEASTEGKLKLVSCTGMVHGEEAKTANDYTGYHKAEAGVENILSKILELPTGDAILDEEYLNPLGINVIKKSKGNFILWGDRTLWVDPAWKFKHQREQMSYYEHVLQENFDWIVFQLNNSNTQKKAITSFKVFFLPEWRKGALDLDKKFEDAAIIKIDSEINTAVTKATGDMWAQLRLALADTVERFNIMIGKAGIFESVG